MKLVYKSISKILIIIYKIFIEIKIDIHFRNVDDQRFRNH